MHFPDVVKKVQTEIDRVVGRERMPKFEDEEALPYVRAFIKEFERYAELFPQITRVIMTTTFRQMASYRPHGTATLSDS